MVKEIPLTQQNTSLCGLFLLFSLLTKHNNSRQVCEQPQREHKPGCPAGETLSNAVSPALMQPVIETCCISDWSLSDSVMPGVQPQRQQ